MALQSKGLCKYCGKEYAKSGMLRHLLACRNRKKKIEAETGETECGYFQVVIQGKYEKDYWLIVEINENATLNEVDRFIRDIWVECCGHLSAFEIDEIRYEKSPDKDRLWGPPAKNMRHKIKNVFSVGQKVEYEYDYGSTTELMLDIHGYRMGKEQKKRITILSRNNPLQITCGQCGINKARWVNLQGFHYGGNPYWCEECLEGAMKEQESVQAEKNYEPEFLLPVCNSPRMGICGYEGSKIYSDQFKPDKR